MNAATQPRQPFAGATFRKIAALRIEGTKRRKVLALIAAYTDAGRPAPPVAELADRLDLRIPTTVGLLKRLERDGYLVATKRGGGRRARTRYRLRLPEDPPSAVASAHGPSTDRAHLRNAEGRATTATSARPTPTREEVNGNGQGEIPSRETTP